MPSTVARKVSTASGRSPSARPSPCLEKRRRRVVYPRRAAIAYYLPALVRWDGRRQAARVARELGDQAATLEPLVVRTGSMGDEITRQARDAWEASRGR